VALEGGFGMATGGSALMQHGTALNLNGGQVEISREKVP
jgi:hypothetical protein